MGKVAVIVGELYRRAFDLLDEPHRVLGQITRAEAMRFHAKQRLGFFGDVRPRAEVIAKLIFHRVPFAVAHHRLDEWRCIGREVVRQLRGLFEFFVMRFLVAREAAVHHQRRERQLKMPEQRAQCAATLRGQLIRRGIPAGVEAKLHRIVSNRIQPHQRVAGLERFHAIQTKPQRHALILGGRLLFVPR